MGLRRDPHPPMPMVIPSRSSETTSASVVRLSNVIQPARGRLTLVHERLPVAVALTPQVELEGEALLEAVAALDVDGIDAVERLLGRPNDGGALLRDLTGDLERRLPRWPASP